MLPAELRTFARLLKAAHLVPFLILIGVHSLAKAQCTYSVSPASAVIGAAGGSSPISVSTGGSCPWTTGSGAAWLTVAPSNFIGSGPAVITAQPNTGPQRVGSVTIAGRTVSVTQLSGCTYTLSTTSVNVTGAGGGQFSVGVTTAAGCPISASSNAAWITVNPQSTSVAVTVAANTGPARTGTVTIAGQTVTVNQVSGCTYSLSATSFNAGPSGGQFTVNVTTGAGCPISPSTNASWITLSVQSSTVSITVAANPSPARTATVTIGGQTVTVNQPSGCTYSFSPTSISVPAAGDQFNTTVSTGIGCPISVASAVPWITAIRESNVVTITVLPNTGPARSGTVAIAGQTLTVNQAAGTCTFTLSTNTINAPVGGGSFNITVTTQSGCTWTAITQAVPWLGTVITTSNAISISIPANSGPPRSGTITVAGQSVTITQAGNCTATVNPASINVSPTGEEFSFDVAATAGCSWQAAPLRLPDLIKLDLISGSPGIGNGRVTYRLGTNNFAVTVSFSIVISTTGATPAQLASVQVTQTSTCVDTRFTSDLISAGPGATTASIGISANPGCGWLVRASASPWLTLPDGQISGTGPGSVPLTLASLTSVPDSATLTLQSPFAVYDTATVSRVACRFSPAGPTTFSVSGSESEIDALLTASPGPGCTPPFSTAANWIQLIRAVGGEKASAEIRILTNTGPARRGVFTLGGQTFTVDQAAAGNTCPTSVSPTRSSISSGATSLSFAVTAAPACAWQVTPSDSWLRVASGASGTGNGTVRVDVAANSTASTRNGSLRIGELTVPITQASSCQYELLPNPLTIGAGGGNARFTVNTSEGCPWTPVSNSSWITIREASTETGQGSVFFSFSTSESPRTGSISVAGRSITINQVPCSAVLAASSYEIGGAGGNLVISLSQQAIEGCPVSVRSFPEWATFLSSNLLGNNLQPGSPPYTFQLNFRIAPNSGAARSGVITLNHGLLSPLLSATINQGATGSESCSYTFSPERTRIGLGGGSSPVDVQTSANCVWTPSSATSWLTLNSSNSIARTGPARFFFAAAPSSEPRTGSLQVGSAVHLVEQIPCSFSVTPTTTNVGGSGGAARFTVSRAVDRGCDVIVDRSQVPWILSHSVGNNTDGSAMVQFVVASNPGPERSGVVQIAGSPVTIRQNAGTACTYTISPSSFTLGTGGGEVSVQVATALFCPVPIVNSSGFIFIAAVAPSAATQAGGPQTLTLFVDPSTGPRTGSLSIAGQTITINQVACSSVNVDPSRPTVGEAGGTITLTGVRTSPALGCPVTATSQVPWITVLSLNPSPLDANTTAFAATVQVAPWTGTPRTGLVQIGGYTFDVRQLACAYNLTDLTSTAPAAGGDITIPTFPAARFGCSPSYQTNTPWLTILGFDGTQLRVRAAPNDGATRTGTITFAGSTISVFQGPVCNYSVTPASVTNIPAAGGSLSLNVNTASYCSWSGQSLAPWITPAQTESRTGPGSVTLTAAANSGASRSGVIRIRNVDIPISQLAGNAGACTYSITPTSANFNQNGGNGSFTISGTPANCQGTWEALGTSPWLTLQSPSSGSGPGPATVNYSVSANGAGGQRTGLITAGGAVHSITQGALSGVISALPSSLLFLGTLNSPPPNPQLIELSFSTGAADLQVSSSAAWLSGLPAQLRSPGNLQVSVQPAGLTAGVYRASLTVSQIGSTQTLSIPVELRIAATANSGLALPLVTRFRWRVGDPQPPAQSVTLFSRPTAQAFASPQGVPSWLQVSAEGETAPLQYSLRLRPELLAPQAEPHRAVIAFPLRNATDSRTEIVVEALIEPRQSGRIVALRNDYTVELPPGGRAANGAGELEIGLANIGAEALSYSVQLQENTSLEIVRGAEGSIAPGRRSWLRARVRAGGLAPGSYPEQIRVLPASGDPLTIDVVVLVPRPDKVLSLSRSALVFTATSSDRDFEPASFFIRNLGAGALPWTLQLDQGPALRNWLQVASGQDQGTASPESEIQVLVSPGGLPAGRHQGLIRVRASGAANPEQTLLVVLEIVPESESSAADINPSAFALPAVQGGTAVTQTLTLRNRKSTPLNFSAIVSTHSGGAWLSGERQGTVPANSSLAYRLALTPGTNAPGVYRGAVRFDFGRGVIEQVNVAMIISPTGTVLPRAAATEPNPRDNACVPTEAIAVLSSQGLTGILRPGSPVAFTAQIRDNCGQLISNRSLLGNGVQVQISNGPSIPLHPQSAGWWAGEWTPFANAVVETEVQAVIEGPEDAFNAGPGLRLASLAQPGASASGPALAAVLNAASFTRNGRVTPGSLVTLFGTNLASREEAIGASVPFSLAGSRVLLGNRPLPLFYAGPGQINAALPHDLNPGEQIQVRVERGTTSSLPTSLTIEDQAPGIFVQAFPGRNQGAVLVAGTVFVAGPTSLGGAYRPIRRGEFLQIFATGLGAVSNPPGLGELAGVPLSLVAAETKILLGGRELTPAFSGLAPGFIGLYQMNVQVPEDFASSGDAALQLRIGSRLSNEVLVAIQ